VGRSALLVVMLALALSACGSTPPQAPLPYAKKLDSATSGISTACGEAYQLAAFPGASPGQLTTLEVTASSSALKLASVYVRNPSWIYQGDTVREIVGESLSMLRSCGLARAAGALQRATAKR
jgi:hypothetical protein